MRHTLGFRQYVHAVFVVAFVTLTGCVGAGGTTVALRTNELAPPKEPAQGRVLLLNQAGDQYPGSPQLGKAVWTAFKAELGAISSDVPPKEKVVHLTKVALEKAGYEVQIVTEKEAGAHLDPVLHVNIDQFAYEMWGYWYPYVPIEGRISVVFALQSPDGRQLDGKVLTAEGKESCWFGWCASALETAMAHNLTKIMNQFIDWTAERSFRSSLIQAKLRQDSSPSP